MSAAGQAVLNGFVVICMVLILVWTVMNGCSNLRGLDSNGNPLHNRHAAGEFLTMGRMHTPSTPGGRLSAQSVDKDYEDEDDEEMLNNDGRRRRLTPTMAPWLSSRPPFESATLMYNRHNQ